MHILFVHQAYPAQFGPMAEWMARSKKHRVTFLSGDPNRWHGSIENIRYQAPPEPRRRRMIPWPQEFENKIQHCLGVVTALKKRLDIRPDLIVGHSGFGSTLLLPEVRDCPIVNYFEYYMHPRGTISLNARIYLRRQIGSAPGDRGERDVPPGFGDMQSRLFSNALATKPPSATISFQSPCAL